MRSQKTLGIIFLLLGFLFLADTLNWFFIGDVINTWWPLILILIGMRRLSLPSVSPGSAWMFILVGIAFQLAELDILAFNQIFHYWPVILIVFGLYLVFLGGHTPILGGFLRGRNSDSDEIIDSFSIFGGSTRMNTSQNFRGGSIAVIMGGFNLDLTGAALSPEGAVLEISSIMGGGKIIIPGSWRVSVNSLPIFGGVDHERAASATTPDATGPLLKIHTTTIMGGVKILSV